MRYLLFLLVMPLAAQDFDLLITGGRVVDGTGSPWYRADIGVRGRAIAEIGNLAGRSAKQTISVNDSIVAPGFIDMMAGSSLPLMLDPVSGDSKLLQGITTMMAGEGGSDAPQNDRTLPERAVRAGKRWRTFGEYFRLLETGGLPLNVVHNVGAAQVRRVVIGDQDRAPTADELELMKKHVAEAMESGAVGLSTALIYPPGTYAKTEELVQLAAVAGRYGGFYSTHMRNESAQLLEAVGESIQIGERAGVAVHIYHLKAAGEQNWPLMAKAVELIRGARARGLDVTADIYPYIRNGIGLRSFLHPRHYAKGAGPFISTLSEPGVRAALRREVESTNDWENWYRHVGGNWDNVLVTGAPDKRLEGKSIAQIASMQNKDEWAVFFELVEHGDLSVAPKSMDEAQKQLALQTDFVSLCTDASPTNIASATNSHPRAFGSFPRVLAKYVREDRVISLEEAVRKMTSLPANRLRLYSRGRLAPGMAADLVVFDPAGIQDTATFSKPLAFPKGISHVIVNGAVAVDQGRSTGAKSGRILP